MQENRTFDHYFGTYPGTNGLPVGTKVPVDLFDPGSGCLEPQPSTRYVEPYHLEVRRTPDPPHDERTTRAAYNCGMVNVEKGRLPQETRSYLKLVSQHYSGNQVLRKPKAPPLRPVLQPAPQEVAPAPQEVATSQT